MPYNVLAQPLSYWGIHNHTDRSNFRLKDCINKVETLIMRVVEAGMKGLAITDHEVLSAHVEAIKFVKEQKKEGKIPEDFVLGLGNEIYLVDRDELAYARENNEATRFYHFLLVAKDKKGYEGLKKLSSKAWHNGFFFRGMERVPTYKDDLEEIMSEYKGHISASTACIGSEFARTVIDYARTGSMESKRKIHTLVAWYKKLFGDDFYIEIQPSHQEEQIIYNKMALKIAEGYGIKPIVATDAHYLNKEQAIIHETYLKADEGEREVADFYSTTYVMDVEEMKTFFDYLSDEQFHQLLFNTLHIMEGIEEYDLYHEQVVPKRPIPEFDLRDLFADYYDEYEYIKMYAKSPNIEDRFHLHLVEEGFIKYKQEFNKENLSRINEEYKELWLTSENLNQPVSSYYILTEDIVNIMWEVSLVGVSRGSAASWYTVYLMGITQINPIKYNLPHWRHLTHERPELPDIDIDTEASQRQAILERIKERYGFENVLNICTYSTEKLRSAILTGCRGMGIDNDVAQNIANLIPVDKTGMWTLKECLEGDEESGKKPVKELVQEFNEYPGLRETVETIEGLVSGRSVHASGLYIFNEGFNSLNAMMKTTGGQYVTQFNMGDSDYMGGLKMDALTINALDRIRSCMELLLEEGKIEWQGTLRATYEKYIHPDVLDMTSEEMFELLYKGEILDAFQFDSAVGSQAVAKIKPQSFQELSAGNSLMRLSPDGGESPLDRFVRHKNNIEEWYSEMRVKGLNEDEIMVVREWLDPLYGVADTQEIMMLMSMDPRISNFGLLKANKLRKGVAKKSKKVIDQCWKDFKEGCEDQGTSNALRDYVWNSCFKPMFGYSFSLPHIAGYTMILMQELNLASRYGVIYWKTACLSVNSGLFGEKEGNTNYGAVAKAVGDMKGTVLNPDINLSRLGFTPLEKEGKILFGLKPISGLGKDGVAVVMEKRPFSSFEDFVERAVIGKPPLHDPDTNEVTWKDNTLSEKKAITLIKAGCFDKLDTRPRRTLMADFVRMITPVKDKLTMTNLPHIIHEAPSHLSKEVQVYHFRNQLFGRNKVPMNKQLEKDFMDFLKAFPYQVDYSFNEGKLVIDQKSFDKAYKKIVDPLREWVVSPEAAAIFNKLKMRQFWKDNCMGTIEQWEMETVVFYSDKHEMDYVPLNNYFNISNFTDIKPDIIKEWKKWGRREFPIFELSVIAGTVVDKNKDKHIVYLSTTEGVVPIKYTKGSFLHYDKKVVDVRGEKKEVLDPSWFTRGTRLVVVGRRRGDEFVPKVYKDTPYNHTTMKILSYNENDVNMQLEKRFI